MAQLPFPDADSAAYDVDIILQEHQSDTLDKLSDAAYQILETEVNTDSERLGVTFERDESVTLSATQHVGIVSLPDGPTIEIRPKVSELDLLSMLRYAQDIDASTIEQETPVTAGRTFIEALAALYQTELKSVLRQGLSRNYRRTSGTEKYLHGQLNLQQQLQRQGLAPTRFECVYDELTYDTIVNRAILYATTVLNRLVRDQELSQALNRQQQVLRRRVTLTPVRLIDLEQIELTRLSAHYTDLLRLTKLVLRSVFVQDLRAGDRRSFALLVNMNQVFEAVVKRAVTDVLRTRESWSVTTQSSSCKLLSGKPDINIRPDVLVHDEYGEPALVGDAKWKTERPQNSDLYQLVAYQVAHDVPGVLVYPEQDGTVETQYTVRDGHPLHIIELPMARDEVDFRAFRTQIGQSLGERLRPLLDYSV